MECIEARAMKSSYPKEICMKSTKQTLLEDLWCVEGDDDYNVVNEFCADDLLDFSDFNNSDNESFEEEHEEKDSMISSNFSSTANLVSLLNDDEIHLSVDDIENLEWLSQIVDDSTSDISLTFRPPNFRDKFEVNRHETLTAVIPSFTVLGLSYPVPRKCRNKRSNKTSRLWSGLTMSSMHFPDPVHLIDSLLHFQEPPTKKHKKNPGSGNLSDSNVSKTQRRCTHCQIQKTPQWRTGPLGPKTLCNACGVRFKSGRLFPEYRPACSPTFSGIFHSNSHRKVLEMRKKKETEVFEMDISSGSCSFSC